MEKESCTPASVTRGAKPSRQAALDVVKCVAAFLVIYLHTGIPGTLNSYLNAFARIAVPLFFMITGYFYPILVARGRLKAYFRKLLYWTLGVSTFYLLFSVFIYYRHNDLPTLIESLTSGKTLLYWLCFNSFPSSGYHLWYFYAILYALIILVIADRLKLRPWLYRLLPFLLLGNYVLTYTHYSLLYRNFLFIGLPYVLLGCLLRGNEEKAFRFLPSGRKGICLFVLLSFLLGIELVFYKLTGVQLFREHYLLTFPMAVCVFLLALRHPSFGSGSVFARIGQVYSPYIYMFHVFIIACLGSRFSVLTRFPQLAAVYSFLKPVIVFVVTLLVVCAVKLVLDRLFGKGKRKQGAAG